MKNPPLPPLVRSGEVECLELNPPHIDIKRTSILLKSRGPKPGGDTSVVLCAPDEHCEWQLSKKVLQMPPGLGVVSP